MKTNVIKKLTAKAISEREFVVEVNEVQHKIFIYEDQSTEDYWNSILIDGEVFDIKLCKDGKNTTCTIYAIKDNLIETSDFKSTKVK